MPTENTTDTLKTTIAHISQVIGVNASAVGVALSHINEMLTTLSLTLATGFTIYKMIKEWKSNKKNNK